MHWTPRALTNCSTSLSTDGLKEEKRLYRTLTRQGLQVEPVAQNSASEVHCYILHKDSFWLTFTCNPVLCNRDSSSSHTNWYSVRLSIFYHPLPLSNSTLVTSLMLVSYWMTLEPREHVGLNFTLADNLSADILRSYVSDRASWQEMMVMV